MIKSLKNWLTNIILRDTTFNDIKKNNILLEEENKKLKLELIESIEKVENIKNREVPYLFFDADIKKDLNIDAEKLKDLKTVYEKYGDIMSLIEKVIIKEIRRQTDIATDLYNNDTDRLNARALIQAYKNIFVNITIGRTIKDIKKIKNKII